MAKITVIILIAATISSVISAGPAYLQQMCAKYEETGGQYEELHFQQHRAIERAESIMTQSRMSSAGKRIGADEPGSLCFVAIERANNERSQCLHDHEEWKMELNEFVRLRQSLCGGGQREQGHGVEFESIDKVGKMVNLMETMTRRINVTTQLQTATGEVVQACLLASRKSYFTYGGEVVLGGLAGLVAAVFCAWKLG